MNARRLLCPTMHVVRKFNKLYHRTVCCGCYCSWYCLVYYCSIELIASYRSDAPLPPASSSQRLASSSSSPPRPLRTKLVVSTKPTVSDRIIALPLFDVPCLVGPMFSFRIVFYSCAFPLFAVTVTINIAITTAIYSWLDSKKFDLFLHIISSSFITLK